MAELKVLVLGDGLLGKELVNQTGWNYISRKKDSFDIGNLSSFFDEFIKYSVIVNCIANTDTYSDDKESHWKTNYVFVYELIKFCNENYIKLIHISTDYLYTGSVENASEEDVPVHCNTWYGYTKLLSDGLVQLQSKDYLLIRCSHKPNPFPYEKAWIDVIGNFDYVDVISNKIIQLINNNSSGVFNVGTELKSIYDLALKTNHNIESITSSISVPKNISLNINKMENNLNKKKFFSIAIPAYGYNGKGREFLNQSFNILFSQVFKDFEVVISDHSQDDTIKDLCEYWSKHLNIKYFRNEIGRGVISPNLNNALKNCSGKWIKILFQDDLLFDANTLKNIKDFIDFDKDMNWIASSFWHTNDGVSIYRRIKPTWPELPIWAGHNHIGCPSAITIKNEDILYFDDNLNWLMDCDYYQRMFLKHGLPKILDVDTMINRVVEDRLTNTIPEQQKISEYEKLKNIYG
jgi:dTDP-4-dehydrorhamnose reductase